MFKRIHKPTIRALSCASIFMRSLCRKCRRPAWSVLEVDVTILGHENNRSRLHSSVNIPVAVDASIPPRPTVTRHEGKKRHSFPKDRSCISKASGRSSLRCNEFSKSARMSVGGSYQHLKVPSNHSVVGDGTSQSETAIHDDAEGHLICTPGDIIEQKYEIINYLSEGTFGRVFKVRDLESSGFMALKVVQSGYQSRLDAKWEISVLEKIRELDPQSDHLCVKMIEWFDYCGHICIVFDLLGESIFDFMSKNDFQPFPLKQLRHIAYQLCHAVNFLHENELIHTDIKLENIVFANSDCIKVYSHANRRMVNQIKNTDIQLIDFGGAIFHYEDHIGLISTRPYRAPEVILEMGWSQSCDVWSIGCALFELYAGKKLFETDDDRHHLALMERILGKIPYGMTMIAKKDCFSNGNLVWNESSTDGLSVREQCKPLSKYQVSVTEDHSLLFDLIKKMLEYEPSRRITVAEALRHPFFKKLPPHHSLGDVANQNQVILSNSNSSNANTYGL